MSSIDYLLQPVTCKIYETLEMLQITSKNRHTSILYENTCESKSTSYLQSSDFMANWSSWGLCFALGRRKPLYPDFYILDLGLPHSSCHLLPGLFFVVCLLVLETRVLPHSINLTQFHLGYFLWNYSSGRTAAVISNKHRNSRDVKRLSNSHKHRGRV